MPAQQTEEQGGDVAEHEMPMGEMPDTPLGISEMRDASGTSWQPDSTPMFMWHWKTAGWSVGLHTNVFAGYDSKASDRGDDKLVSINWVMAMARHAVGDGDVQLRAMLSLEPFTVGKTGYPLLLQTGEAVDGMPLHDRQHPHDLFMEVAARLRQPIGETVGVELYVAPSGEPAIGPPAFPHRFTAMADPLAPLGHHWHDSTHISFGVVTAGVFTRRFKLEGSWFNGREPDDERYDFDLRTPDSFAARLTVNPTTDTSAHVSWARLDSPEQLEPDVSVQRATASLIWNLRAGDRDLAVTGLVGRNDPSEGPATNAGLAEAALMWRGEHTVFTRAELLEKSGHDLALPMELDETTFGMASFSAGYVYDVKQLGDVVPGLGFVATVDAIGSDLEPFYGTRVPWGGMVFVRLRPPEMTSHGM
ncbi:MAG TPA: hypothetical protein VFQ53_36250 [Kofleriaceae bacterium]|nr:hypothetical protein [Kofleriaceae bacterium]